MHGEGFFSQALVYLVAAVVAVPVARRLGMASVLGYLVAGVVIGPFALHWVGEEGQSVLQFAEFGVVMMLFLVGLELEPDRLWRLRKALLGMGGLQVGVTSLAGTALGLAAGLPWRTALVLGLVLAMSSTAIVLQSLVEKGQLHSPSGRSSFAVLLFQDLAVIPMLALIPLLSARPPAAAHGSTLASSPAWVRAGAVLAAVAVLILAGRLAVVPVLRLIARTRLREMFTASALLLVISAAMVAAKAGLSPAFGTFLAGVVLANSEYRHELETDLEPFKGLLLGLFFIAVGASIDFGLVSAKPVPIAVALVAAVAVKLSVLFAVATIFRMPIEQNLLFSFALAQVGEFAFVLVSFAAQNGVLSAEIAAMAVAVTALSMAGSPVLMAFYERAIARRLGTDARPGREHEVPGEASPVIIAGFGRFGHVAGRLLLVNGVRATVLDADPDHVDLLRKLGFRVYYGDACRLDLLKAAGADRARLFIVAVDEPEKVLEIVRAARREFPQLTILARARGRDHAYQLLEAGVDRIYRETLDTSLRAGADALRLLGFRAFHARRAALTFRRHDEESVRELARLRHDRRAYILRAREHIADLEEVLRKELAAGAERDDEAWDSESLRREFGGS